MTSKFNTLVSLVATMDIALATGIRIAASKHSEQLVRRGQEFTSARMCLDVRSVIREQEPE